MSVPKIDHYQFGQIQVDGKDYSRDLIIFPDHVKAGWRREQGHSLSSDDLSEVFREHPEVLVVGQGAVSRMEVPDETQRLLQEAGIELIAQPTGQACETYNALRESRRVVAALHLTC